MIFREPIGSWWRRLLLRVIAFGSAIALVTVLAMHIAQRNATDQLEAELARAVETYSASLQAWQQQYWALAAVYAEDPALAEADTLSGRTADSLRSRLMRWNSATGSQATVIVRPDGSLLAGAYASNIPDAETGIFDGDLLRTAANGGLGRSFVTWSNGQRGYAFAFEVGSVIGPSTPIVVVVAPLSELEQYLQMRSDIVLVADDDGIIAAANRRDAIGKPLGGYLSNILSAKADGPREASVRNTRNRWTLSVTKSSRALNAYVRLVGWLAASSATACALLALLVLSRRSAYLERIALQRSMRAELEETVEQRTAEMREANLHLRDEIERRHRIEKNLRDTHLELTQAAKLASVGQMSAVVSHELNQPLTAIRSNAELAGEYLDRDDIAQTRAKLGAILDMTDRIARLTKRLLNFSRQPRSDAYPVALSVPLDDALGIMEPRMRKEDATFSIEVEPDLLVMGGRNRLSQVFINLIANALDACAGDDVPCHVTVSSQCEGGTVELRFSDNGPGLPDDQQARVFEAFYSTKERGKGLGLGLSVSAKIVSEFGGELLYRPGERGGATFVVALPSLAQKDKAA